MKKLCSVLLVSILCLSSIQLKSQTNIFTVGTSNLNVGLHVPTYFSNMILPPISVSYDYGIADFGMPGSLGIGGYFGFSGSKTRYNWNGINNYWSINTNYVHLGPRVSYHFNGIPNASKLDLYAHLFLGVQIRNYVYRYNNQYVGDKLNPYTEAGFAADFKIGAKYWFKDSFGAYLELGWGSISAIELGVSFKF